MSVMLRFQRLGAPKKPVYRLVAIHKRYKRNGEALEILGRYNPQSDEKMQVKQDRLAHWLGQGAQTSDSVRSQLKKAGIKIP